MTNRRKLLIGATCALLVVGLGVGYAKRGAKAGGELDAAEAALRRHAPLAARTHLDRLLAAEPNNKKAHFLAAQAARRSDDYSRAEAHLTASEADTGPTEASRLEWAMLGVQQGDFGDDEERLRTAVGRRHAEESAILEALAKGYAAAFRWPEAIAALQRLLEREPDHVPALILRAAIAERFRRAEAAEEDLRRAVAAAPNSPAAHAALAGWLNLHGHTREAIAHFETARQLRPTDAATHIGLARALADGANLAEAERQLDGIPADDPRHADGLVERGRLLLRQNRPADAEPILERATRAAPWHRDAHRVRLTALKALGRTEAVAACEARLAELTREDAAVGPLKLKARDTPGDAAVRMSLWEWAKRSGQPDEEVAWLSEILRADPKHAAAHAAFADYFDRAGQPRRAALHRTPPR